MVRALLLASTFTVTVGCGPAMPVPPPVTMMTVDAGAWFDADLSRCRIGGEAPRTVDEVIARINALPMPVSAPCFTASLPRPLTLVATTSRFSAQPAGGAEDPRLFIFTPGAVLSVVIGGQAKDLLEIGELVAPNRTLKAEIVFPVTAPITREEAYAHLDYAPTITSCGLCHTGEEEHPAHRLARTSIAFRPVARTLMSVERARVLSAACDPATQRERCLAWASVFAYGEVVQGTFPAAFADFIK